ncbi:MAG: beta-ketoacyl-[acyl-carrier-protein] synthase II [Spirochaetaceae bacterium]|nr:MAG: beta-ketoacyl-[acyl-carrier-protein] synthase II [Spirochaetaceae bacterium]
MASRVVITGLGAVTPLGNSVDETWDGMISGRSGVAQITKFDASGYPATIAGEVKGFEIRDYIDSRDARKMDTFSHYSVAGAMQAMKDAGLGEGSFDPERIGVILGVGIGGFESLESSYEALFLKGPERTPPMTIPKLISNEGPGNVAITLNCQGPCYAVTTACSSATDAITNAYRLVSEGLIDVAITGGVEACITRLGVMGFSVIHALTTEYNDRPTEASRPFDKLRSGFVIGEGGGVLTIESLEHAQKRGARIYAEIVGTAMTCDAQHLTAPHTEGRGAIQAMTIALRQAGVQPGDVDYINAHGTSTPINDPFETKAIKAVFGDAARSVKISSTKSMTGHCIGAAGGVEAIACVKAITEGVIPPTINQTDSDPECDLDYTPNVAVRQPVNVAMSNTFGFGGHNGVVVFRKFAG